MTIRNIFFNGEVFISLSSIIDDLTSFLNFCIANYSKSQSQPHLKELKFFKAFNTTEKREVLKQAINDLLPDINENNGRDWVVLYIAYTFAIGKRVLLEDYSFFFTDIETLFPGLLKNINPDRSGYDRYSRYTDLLSKECKLWYICNGRLLDVSEWRSSEHVYQMKKEKRNSVQELTTKLLQSLLKAK